MATRKSLEYYSNAIPDITVPLNPHQKPLISRLKKNKPLFIYAAIIGFMLPTDILSFFNEHIIGRLLILVVTTTVGCAWHLLSRVRNSLYPAVHGAATPKMEAPWNTLEQSIQYYMKTNGRIN